MNCPSCQTLNDPDARFCTNCGASLAHGGVLAIQDATPAQPLAPPAKLARRPFLLAVMVGGALLVIALAALGIFFLTRQPKPEGAVAISEAGGTLNLADGAQLTLPPEGLSGPLRLRAKAIPAAQFQADSLADNAALAAAAAQLPPHLRLYSAVYHFEVDGPPPKAALLNLPRPATAPHTVDLYAWDGAAWRWLPTHIDLASGTVAAQLDLLPQAVALMQTQPGSQVVTADLPPDLALPSAARGALTELWLTGFHLRADGSFELDLTRPEIGEDAILIPSLRNWREEGVLTADTDSILIDPNLRQRHVEAIVGVALAGNYPAVQLDYRGLDPAYRQEFSLFVEELATALHAQNRALQVRVEAPVQVAANRWETGAYDWTAIGRAADRLQIPLPTDPATLRQGQTEAWLTWALGQVERAKLQPILSLYSLDISPEGVTPLPATQTLAYLGPIHTALKGDNVEPGDEVSLSLAGLSRGVLEIDPTLSLLHFVGPDETGQTHQFYLPTNATLSRWLQQATDYNLAGVALEGLWSGAPNSQTWQLLQGYRQSALPGVEAEPIWVWQVTAADTPAEPLKVETRPITEISYAWTAPDTSGEYQVTVALSTDGGNAILPIASLAIPVEEASAVASDGDNLDTASEGDTLSQPTRVPTPTPTSTPTPTPEAPPPLPTPIPPANNCPDSHATITSPVNGATIRGIVPFMGTAYLDTLIYYKFEYKPADSPTWQFLTKVDYKWITDDKLMDFYTSTVAPGVYDFRLIVVDKSGNFPPPCEIRVTVTR
jgi:hypothetical protein